MCAHCYLFLPALYFFVATLQVSTFDGMTDDAMGIASSYHSRRRNKKSGFTVAQPSAEAGVLPGTVTPGRQIAKNPRTSLAVRNATQRTPKRQPTVGVTNMVKEIKEELRSRGARGKS